jgi:hypothetical protein
MTFIHNLTWQIYKKHVNSRTTARNFGCDESGILSPMWLKVAVMEWANKQMQCSDHSCNRARPKLVANARRTLSNGRRVRSWGLIPSRSPRTFDSKSSCSLFNNRWVSLTLSSGCSGHSSNSTCLPPHVRNKTDLISKAYLKLYFDWWMSKTAIFPWQRHDYSPEDISCSICTWS